MRSDIIVAHDAGRECEETQQHLPLAVAITLAISIPCHRYRLARFVATETANITKDDDVAIVYIPVSLSNKPPLPKKKKLRRLHPRQR